MAQQFIIHPDNPQSRGIALVAQVLRSEGLVILPTDTSYCLACMPGCKKALDRIRRIRNLDDKHNFTLLCRDLSELSQFARVDNRVYRLLKKYTPGPYTFLLKASKDVPRRLVHPRKKTIGLRVSAHAVLTELLAYLEEPLLISSLLLPEEERPHNDPEEIFQQFRHCVDGVVDSGVRGVASTTVVDLQGDKPLVVRTGAGESDLEFD